MKVLFITSTRLGDGILSTGLLDHLLNEHPEAKVTVACGWLPSSVFEGFPNVENIIVMKKEKRHGHWIKLWKRVIGTRWDMVIDLRDSAVSRLIFASKRYIFSKHIDQSQHKVKQAAEVMKLDSIPVPNLHFTQSQKEFADILITDGGPVIGVGPSANWIGKTWPAENFIEVLQWLISDDGLYPGARVAVFAAPGEEEQAAPVLESIPEAQRIDGIAKGLPGDVAAALSKCDFYIGNDSGLMHAAAAAGVPTLGLFGPSYPHLYAPYGDHCAIAQTPETFDQLIDFEGYSSKTFDRSLMVTLKQQVVIDIIKKEFEIIHNASHKHAS
ncbi:MAG: glycosyltransferase family 9 protein [Alphaproteobacteria bacterium]|nr:glycosyltransferase family 9 protein [Alphaproteobacteria bacterium]